MARNSFLRRSALLDVAVEPGVVEGDGGAAGEVLGQGQVGGVEAAGRDAQRQGQRAQGAAAGQRAAESARRGPRSRPRRAARRRCRTSASPGRRSHSRAPPPACRWSARVGANRAGWPRCRAAARSACGRRAAGSTQASSVCHMDAVVVDQGHDAEVGQERHRPAAADRASVASRSSELARTLLASARNAERRVASSAAARAACSRASATRSSACRLTCSRHPEQVDEHADLGPQDLRHDRRQDVVDRARANSPGRCASRRRRR